MEKKYMYDMAQPDTKTIVAMADSMSADAIVGYFKERGIDATIVTGGIYPVGIKIGNTTLFIPSLQPSEKSLAES